MSDRLVFSVRDVLNDRVNVEQLVARYVFLRASFVRYKTLAKALNHVVKFGWRAVGFSAGYVLLERIE